MISDPKEHETFDFAFIDADKQNYPNYYDILIPLLKSKGFIMIDNSVWRGLVVEQDLDKADERTRGIIEVVRKAMKDDRVDTHTIMIADGLTFVQKK